MSDLTIFFLTVNKVPDAWAEYHRKVLLEAVGDSPIIIFSKKKMRWGVENIIQEDEPSMINIYRQILKGAKLAKTPYFAIAEDDTLYHKDHFSLRPPMDSFGYDMHRWGLFTWGKPTYYYKDRISNAALIAPRELAIETLTERFAKYPNSNIGELGKEGGTRLNVKKIIKLWADTGLVYFSHVNSLDPTEQHKSKKMGVVQAFDIPYWKRAEDLRKHFI